MALLCVAMNVWHLEAEQFSSQLLLAFAIKHQVVSDDCCLSYLQMSILWFLCTHFLTFEVFPIYCIFRLKLWLLIMNVRLIIYGLSLIVTCSKSIKYSLENKIVSLISNIPMCLALLGEHLLPHWKVLGSNSSLVQRVAQSLNNVGCSASLKVSFEINLVTKGKQGPWPIISFSQCVSLCCM